MYSNLYYVQKMCQVGSMHLSIANKFLYYYYNFFLAHVHSVRPLLMTCMSYVGQKCNTDLLLLFRDINGSERTPKLSLIGKLLDHDTRLIMSKLADNIITVQRVNLGTVVSEKTSTIFVTLWCQSAKLFLIVNETIAFQFDCGIM